MREELRQLEADLTEGTRKSEDEGRRSVSTKDLIIVSNRVTRDEKEVVDSPQNKQTSEPSSPPRDHYSLVIEKIR